MDKKTERGYEVRAGIFKALAHPSRLFIVEQLAAGERCVCELAEMIGADVSTVSRHLAVLRNAGVLESDKRGLQVYYRLRFPCVLRFFDCVGEVLAQSAEDHRALAGGGAKE
jgi:ArsR family transcriptional regulator